jgi:hypothetical protein
MVERKKCYYAHCLSIFNTLQERRDITTLESIGFEVINPNSQECSDGYKKNGMDYFKKFPEECEIVAFRSLPDGRIPAGISKEIEMFCKANRTVIELPSGLVRRTASVEETREYLREVGQR